MSYQAAIKWLVGQINNDSQLQSLGNHKAYSFSAPEKTAYPFVVINKQAGSHKHMICRKAYDSHFLAIKCVDTGFDGGAKARNIMERVSTLLSHATADLPDGQKILSITESSSFEYDEQESGNTNFYHSVIVLRVVVG